MTAKSDVLGQIRRCFSIWASDLQQNSAVNRLEDNISSEDIAAGLLNLIYGYNLVNANAARQNQKGIDLFDTDAAQGAGVAAQITSSNTRQKAIKTMRSFSEGEFGQRLCDEYETLILLILSMDDKFANWDKLGSDEYVLSILNLKDLSKSIEHFDLDALERILAYLRRQLGLSDDHSGLRQRICRIAHILDADAIASAARECTTADVEKFYTVDLSFRVMLDVISSDQDVPHPEMDQRVQALCRTGTPVILAGRSGTGKSAIALRAAVSWARSGGTALWISLAEDTGLTDMEAAQFYRDILQLVPDDKNILLCLDSPWEWADAFRTLSRNWPGIPRLRLLLAERPNRLTRLTDPSADLLHHWFDDAVVTALMNDNPKYPLRVKEYAVEFIPDTYQRRMAILNKTVPILIRRGGVTRLSPAEAVRQFMKDYGKPHVSLVELIYRSQYALQKLATKPERLRLDWDEWRHILRNELGVRKSAQQLYGIIALCSFFDVPVSVSLFCRFFRISELDLTETMNNWQSARHVEPVILQKRKEGSVLLPKHDVIAELFFLFHQDTLPVDLLMRELLETMDEYEIEAFLKAVVRKKPIQKGYQPPLGRINYRDYLNTIYRRTQNGNCGLSGEGKARLGLGLLYTVPPKNQGLGSAVLEQLAQIDPGIDGSVLTAYLYTEWGRLLASLKMDQSAEEKLCAVADNYPAQLHARTELGRLLAKQPGREQEAERFLQDILSIDPKNIQARTELGRLLAKQPGREQEAERLLREAMQIDPKHIQSRTELARLLAKQPGREQEAIPFLQKAIRLDPKQLHPRTVLAELYIKLGKISEAESLYQEIRQIDPNNTYAQNGLARIARHKAYASIQ